MNYYGFFLVLQGMLFALEADRPSYFPTCYRNDPKLNQCLLEATELMRPYLIAGIPELKLTSFDPLTIPEIKLEQGTDALNIKASLTNVTVRGLSNYKFSRFDFDVINYQFFCQATIKNINLSGDYTVSGRILIAPIEGKGKFTADIGSAEVFVHQIYKEAVLDDGKVHIVPTATNSSIKVVKPRAHLDGLFNGDPQLNAATNKAINDNVDALFEDLRPVVEHTIDTILEELLLRSIVEQISWDELYPISEDFV